MILYYMELVPSGVKVYSCQDYDRHKVWKQYPNAKEIFKKEYELMEQMINEINKANESLTEQNAN